MLNTFQFVQCLQILISQNDDGNATSEAFQVLVSGVTVAPVSLLVEVEVLAVLVTVFEQCVDGEVRLEGGNNPMQGRVQLCLGGVFGTVCDTGTWTRPDADVVCAQLGYIPLPGTKCTGMSY